MQLKQATQKFVIIIKYSYRDIKEKYLETVKRTLSMTALASNLTQHRIAHSRIRI